MNASTPSPLLVVGAGIAGVTAALEAAEAGREVVLIEREPTVGGRVLRSHHYFPKLCPPSCGMEINVQRLKRNPRVRLMTNTEVVKADRSGDDWTVTLKTAPAYVNERCTMCGDCEAACSVKVPDPFNMGMCEVPAVRMPHPDAYPQRYVMDREALGGEAQKVADACKYGAIDLDATETEETLTFGAVVLATGWHPYPLENLTELGGGVLPDVVANVMLERLRAPAGPTEGKIVRPSDGRPPKRVAFVQCAGSRDVNHLAYCSGICCLASLKQATYVKEQLPETEVTMYYIDRRTPGRNEKMLTEVSAIEGVNLVKGKVGKITAGAGGVMDLRVENADTGELLEAQADLVVLATGMESNLKGTTSPFQPRMDEDGFALDDPDRKIFVAGVARRPEDVASTVRDATGTAAKASAAAGGKR